MERRNFLKALACVPAAPVLLRGMDWAAFTPAEATAKGVQGYSCEVPPGTILPYAGDHDAPPGFLPCDGRAIPQAAFQRLHEAIGDAFGAEPARRFRWRKFRVPDFRASSRPLAAVQAEERMREAGMAPAMPINIRYVIRT